MRRAAILAAAVLLCAAVPASAEGRFRRVSVLDGDTVVLNVSAGFVTGFKLRLLGLDAPEENGKCEEERRAAAAATARLRQLVAGGVRIASELEIDAHDRLLARLFTRQDEDVSEVLIREGLARRMGPNEARRPWCEPAAQQGAAR